MTTQATARPVARPEPPPVARQAVHQLVQLSDTHITLPGQLVEGRVDTAAALRTALARVERLPVAPDALLFSGDLCEAGTPAEYAHFCDLLAATAARWRGRLILMPGNHDDPLALREVCGTRLARALMPAGPASDPAIGAFSYALPGLDLISLDTPVPGQGHGALSAAQLRWLAARLEATPAATTMLALHHPPFRCHMDGLDAIGVRDGAAELAALVARHPQVERVVCGHLHHGVSLTWAGTLAVSAPSTAHQMHFDLGPGRPIQYQLSEGGLLVHSWRAGEPMVTHRLQTGAADGPHAYAD